MFLFNSIWVGLRYIARVFHNVAEDVPSINLPGIGSLLGWLRDRFHDVENTLEWAADELRDIADWFELVHDIVQYIIDFVDIEDWLKDLWGLPELSIGWIAVRSLDALRWMLATSEDFADEIVSLLRESLKRAFDLIDLSADGLRWVVEEAIDDLIRPGEHIGLRILSMVWEGISGAGGVLEDWIRDSAEWIIDDGLHLGLWFAGEIIRLSEWIINEGLRLGDWLRDQVTGGAEWVGDITLKSFWQMLDFMVNMPDTFITAILDALILTYKTFADRIIDLAELILDHVWGED